MNAQTKQATPVGEYSLHGVPETASGFLVNGDGTFRFFFSYGALDRYGEGRWTTQGDTLVLNSRVQPPAFVLKEAGRTAGSKITVQIAENNAALLRHFSCRIQGAGRQQEETADEKGIIEFAPQPIDSLELAFEFCADRKMVFVPAEKGQNRFVFAPQPTLMEVFFSNFRLALTADGLHGGHPLSDKTTFRYEKTR